MKHSIERQLQTLAVGGWNGVVLYGECLCIALTVLLIRTDYYWLMLIYFYFIARDRQKYGYKTWAWVRRWKWWEYYRDYFPLSLVKSVDLDPDRNYLFCSFPHGLLASGCFGSLCTDATGFHELFPGMTAHVLTLDSHFIIPFIRELVSWLGMSSVSATSIKYLLNKENGTGRCVTIVVGGAAESLNCHPGEYKLVLKRRKGFVKLAMLHGSPLVPVFSFGETDICDQIPNPKGSWMRYFQEKFIKLTGIAFIIPFGNGIFQKSIFSILPYRKPIVTVVGTPLEVSRNVDPTAKDIEAVHEEFTKLLIELFEKEKYKYLASPNDAQLIIE